MARRARAHPQDFPGRLERVELVRWFPETARAVATYPTVDQACQAFAGAGFRQEALEPVPETYSTSLAALLGQVDTLRRADTTLRSLSEAEFQRGKERLCRAAQAAAVTPRPEPRSNPLDLLVLRYGSGWPSHSGDRRGFRIRQPPLDTGKRDTGSWGGRERQPGMSKHPGPQTAPGGRHARVMGWGQAASGATIGTGGAVRRPGPRQGKAS